MQEKLKVAVIGGGIIGLYVAWKLAGRGHDVSIFDRKKEEDLGQKCCSSLVSERIKQFLPLNDRHIESAVKSCIIHFSGKDVRLDFSPKHLVLDRNEVSALLVSLCKTAGVKMHWEYNVKDLPEGYDKVIGCDGSLSLVRKILGIGNPPMRMGIQFFENSDEVSEVVETFLTPSGFCWKIPKKGRVEYGALGNIGEVKKDLENRFGSHEGISAALVPFPSILSGIVRTKTDNIALCGDAMGIAKPWSGGGIIWGLYAAEILVRDFPDFKKYEKDIRRFFLPKIIKGNIENQAVHFLGRFCPQLIPSVIKYDNDFSYLTR